MIKDDISAKLREYVRTTLSPTKFERGLISDIYQAFSSLLNDNCIQIGSYARFTAIRPLHDLDILLIVGPWEENNHSPEEELKFLYSKIDTEFENPTDLSLKISLQTHSVTVVFSKGNTEVVSVDIVPAFMLSKNEFGDDIYKVPEIVRISHGQKRVDYYKSLTEQGQEPGWINSDPRGYIKIAKQINDANNDFRKVAKFIKAWKYSCEAKNSNFKLKSFHLEQIVTSQFRENSDWDIFDGIFHFFISLPERIEAPQIPDRADPSTFVDEYLNELTRGQKELIVKARDGFLRKLEEFSPAQSVSSLLDAVFYQRANHSEQYLFDFGIHTFLDDIYAFQIMGEVQERKGFRKFILSKAGTITIDRKIKFRPRGNAPKVDFFKWKVKNDDASPEPRGEITDHNTRNDPENTKYKGSHFVECYAILNNVCVAKARQDVVLNPSW
jgi:hypothetical protein